MLSVVFCDVVQGPDVYCMSVYVWCGVLCVWCVVGGVHVFSVSAT